MPKDDDTINLRQNDDFDSNFKIEHFEKAPLKASYLNEDDIKRASDKVKVKFDKFVNLVATHSYEDIIDKYMDEDIIISTDLLTDLASTHEEKEDKKTPLIFIIGILLGAVAAWFIFKN